MVQVVFFVRNCSCLFTIFAYDSTYGLIYCFLLTSPYMYVSSLLAVVVVFTYGTECEVMNI